MKREQLINAIRSNNNKPHLLDFSDEDFSNEILDGINLEGAFFDRAKFINTSMVNCILRETRLRNANLSGARLWFSNLEKANLQGAVLVDTDLLDAILTETNFGRSSLGGRILQEKQGLFEEAHYIYIALRRNFSSVGRYDDISWAYFKERQTERKSLSPVYHLKHRKDDFARFPALHYMRFSFLEWIGAIIKEIFWGYGERPLNTIFLAISVVGVFAMMYDIVGGLSYTRTTNWVDFINYSLAAFVGSSSTVIMPISQLAQFLTNLETAVGIAILAMLLFAMGQKISMR